MKTRTRRCVICGRIYYGFGHIAAPVAEGRCCDECHAEHVEPERTRLLRSPSATERDETTTARPGR